MMLLFSVTVLLAAAAAAFDVIKVSIYNIADLQSWRDRHRCSENCFELKNVLPHNLRLLLEQLTQSTYITYVLGATVSRVWPHFKPDVIQLLYSSGCM